MIKKMLRQWQSGFSLPTDGASSVKIQKSSVDFAGYKKSSVDFARLHDLLLFLIYFIYIIAISNLLYI